MKWTRHILILIMIYLVCTARTCNEDEATTASREEQYIMNLKDSVKHVFMSDSLTDQLLRAYEVTALEKLNDFADYMRIISDTALDLKFRQHAAELVKGLFISDDVELHSRSKIYTEPDLITLEFLLANSLSEGISYRINPLQITVSNPFVSKNDSTFIGNLSFINKCVPLSSKDTSEIKSRELVIDIFLIKKLRSFGNDQIKVWDVYLGDIK